MFEKYLEGFKGYLEMRNFSNDTVEGYGKNIKMFFSFIKENYPRVEKIEQLSRTIIEDYHSYITVFKTKKNKPYATKTKFVKIASLKSFFKYLLIQDYIVSNPTANLEYPKRERTLPRDVPTIKEVQRMLNYPDLSTPNGLRNKAILELVYACGIRTCELSNLKIKDVNLKEQMAIIINGKGGKTRYVPIGQYAAYYITQYLKKGRRHLIAGKAIDNGYLFISANGNRFNVANINACVIHSMVRNLRIDKNISIYSFRHAVATHLLQNNVDIRYVAELLGHNSLTTTQIYCHVDISDLKKMHALHHPREKE